MRKRARVVTEFEYALEPPTPEQRKRFEEVNRLRQQVRNEKDEKKRTDLGETLRTKLGEIFDEDLTKRDDSLKKLEARVAKLREAVEKRRKNRDRVITLQVDSVMLAAEGLAFPGLDGNGPVEVSGWRHFPSTRASSFERNVPADRSDSFGTAPSNFEAAPVDELRAVPAEGPTELPFD